MAAFALAAVALFVRGSDLAGSGIQNDEQVWHERSARFFQTVLGPLGPERFETPEVFWPRDHVDITERNFAFHGYPFTIRMPAPHPGIPVGFLMGAAYTFLGEGTTSWSLEVAPVLEVTRYPNVALGAVLVLVVFFGGRRLVGSRAALFAAAIVACEPVLVGFSRLARLDLSAAVLTTSAILCYVAHCTNGRRRWLLASGGFTGLALATNPYGLYVAPAILASRQLLSDPAPTLPWHHGLRPWRAITRRDRAWLGMVVAAFVVAYPNLWPNPIYGLWDVGEGILATPHVRGEGASRMPVSHWFYLLRSPQHLLPSTVLLACVGVYVGARRRRKETWVLLAWALGILLLLSAPPGRKDLKNFLLVLPVVALFAGLALDRAVLWLEERGRAPHRWRPEAVAVAILLALGLSTTAHWWPYPALYTWPWQRDPQALEFREILGGGEGVKEAVEYIVERDPDDPRIAMFTGENNAAYYHPRDRVGNVRREVERLREFDWLVVLPQLTFAGPDDHPMVAWVREREPTAILRHHQIEMVRIYRLPYTTPAP